MTKEQNYKIIPTFLNPQQSLDNRYRLLCKQRDDAKDLKDNLDRRERLVSTFLSRQLTDTQLQEYRRFIQTKASLLIRQKDLDEKQRLGEEQLEALLSSIPPWTCTAWKCLSGTVLTSRHSIFALCSWVTSWVDKWNHGKLYLRAQEWFIRCITLKWWPKKGRKKHFWK